MAYLWVKMKGPQSDFVMVSRRVYSLVEKTESKRVKSLVCQMESLLVEWSVQRKVLMTGRKLVFVSADLMAHRKVHLLALKLDGLGM